MLPQELFSEARKQLIDGNLVKARELFEKLVGDPMHSGEALSGLGIVEIQAKNWQRAAMFLETALGMPDRHDNVAFNLGTVRERLGQHRAAVEAYERELELNPGHLNAKRQLQRLTRPKEETRAQQPAHNGQGRSSPMTEFQIPRSADELAEYKRWVLEKKKVDVRNSWNAQPLAIRLFILVGFGFILMGVAGTLVLARENLMWDHGKPGVETVSKKPLKVESK